MVNTVKYNQIKWHHIQSITEESLNFLKNNFKFHELDIDDVASYQQRPKIDSYKDYVFFVIHLPSFEEGRIKMREVDFFVGKDYVITVTSKQYSPLDELFAKMEESSAIQEKLFNGGPQFLFYNILDKFISSIFPIVNQLGGDIDVIDRSLVRREMTDIISSINFMRRNLIVLQTPLKPEISIMSGMEQGKQPFFDEKMTVYWGDLLDHLRKISDQLDDYKELLEGLAISGESLISHRTNGIIKVLTIFSVIFLPLTLIASMYGMNIALPIQGQPLAFPVVVISMIAIVSLMMIYFRIKKWF